MPFPSTRIIPQGWSEHHAQVLPSSMNATVVITDPDKTTQAPLNPVTGTRPTPEPFIIAGGPEDPNPAWRGGVPARIQRLLSDRQVDLGGEQTTARQYLVQLPADVPPFRLGCHVTTQTATSDTQLVGEVLVVVDYQHGSERFTRDVVCTHNQGGQ